MTAAQEPGQAAGASAGPFAGGMGSAYCDTGLIVAAVMGPADPFFDEVARFLGAARLGGVRLVISNLGISEAADVILRRTKAGRRCTDESGREREAVDAEAAAAVEGLVAFIDELKAGKRADILEEKIRVRPNFSSLYKNILEYRGRTPQARKGDTYRHEGVGPIDWIHIALARLAGVPAICTTDRALAQISGEEQYGGLEVVVLRPRMTAGA